MWTEFELKQLIGELEDKVTSRLAPKAKPVPGSQEWFKQLPTPTKTGITMNEIARSVEKPRPPRRPSWARWQR